MGKTSHKAKTLPSEFKVTTPKNPLINNQDVTSMKKLTTTLAIPKYQYAAEPSYQYSIGLDLVVAFFPLLHKSLICD